MNILRSSSGVGLGFRLPESNSVVVVSMVMGILMGTERNSGSRV